MTIEQFLKLNPTKAIVLRTDTIGRMIACVCREDRPNVIHAFAYARSAKEAARDAMLNFYGGTFPKDCDLACCRKLKPMGVQT